MKIWLRQSNIYSENLPPFQFSFFHCSVSFINIRLFWEPFLLFIYDKKKLLWFVWPTFFHSRLSFYDRWSWKSVLKQPVCAQLTIICSKLTIETLVKKVVLVFLLLTLNLFHTCLLLFLLLILNIKC